MQTKVPAATGKFRAYYMLTKPGIIRGNVMAGATGYLFANELHIELLEFIGMLVGLALVIACGCVLNNYIDRGIDAKMERTKTRALVNHTIAVWQAMLFASTLGILGTGLLLATTNLTTAVVALFGLFAYVVIYGIGKRRTVHGTLIGTISGGIPPIVGYVATGHSIKSPNVALLFLVMLCWQMAHFYAIAMYRAKDYKQAGIPVLPVVRGMKAARTQITFYIALMIATIVCFSILGNTGIIYTIVMLCACGWWLFGGLVTYKTKDDAKWGKSMFLRSLLVLPLWCVVLPLGTLLP